MAVTQISPTGTAPHRGTPTLFNIPTDPVEPFTVDWGDGAVETLQSGAAQHTYAERGVYNARAWTDDQGPDAAAACTVQVR